VTVQAVKSWVYHDTTGLVPVFTAEEARLLLDNLDHHKAAAGLTEDEYRVFSEAKAKLVLAIHMNK
jgi:hypothetical protein